ncbi:NAD(P)H-binding protein [Agromyces sp. SYSU K20354]|uniref:SDR family oxidoreductase n=1 Tax=Agromyces cavernae TaxID=2898659 RepID=UPI001E39DC7D|nr:NAD(P)H-binding protein [Agromyces cavernae]MCD2440703.1 NAD(P)H-binding protein [Agromyces cavernae]
MTTLLVTGGTGKLGRPTVATLRSAGHDVRVLSRREGEGHVFGDLRTGVGIRDAVDGVDTVLHLATRNGRGDVALARTLLDECRVAGIRHLIYTSIVGVDRIPLGYYREKLAIEQLLASSGLPHTILRATQFHELVERLFSVQRHLPVVFAPKFSFQPIATGDIATRLAELAVAEAAGRVPDIGGPEQLPASDLARQWEQAASVRRKITPISLPGRIFAGYAAGHNLVPGPAYGTQTFADFLAERHGVRP